MQKVELSPGEAPIRCPAIRTLVREGKLPHMDLKEAAVQELVHVLSGQQKTLKPSAPGSLANVAGYFAIFNHGLPHHKEDAPRGLGGFLHRVADWIRKPFTTTDAAAVAAGRRTDRRFNLHLHGSPGEHPGTVNFFHKDSGEFLPDQFRTVMSQVSDGKTLTIDGIARMIIRANNGEWDVPGSTLDLAKSAGEWALMVCALRKSPSTTDIAIDDVERLYRAVDSTQLLMGSHSATAQDWVRVTAQITAAIARIKESPLVAIANKLHEAYEHINSRLTHKLCPCMTCNWKVWKGIEGRA